MLKKFFSNALLSVVMDKTARQRLDKRKSDKNPSKNLDEKQDEDPIKKAKKKKSTAKAEKPKPKPTIDSDVDILKTIAGAVAQARKEVEDGIPQRGAGTDPQRMPTSRPKRTSIQDNLDAANPPVRAKATRDDFVPSQESPRDPSNPSMSRAQLIENALAIQKQKAHILDDLDPRTRDKLKLMAQYALAPDSLPDELKKEFGIGPYSKGPQNQKIEQDDSGLVDNIGGSRKPRIPRRRK